jgi:conjugal transfer pilus assembly protein TraD
MRPSDRTAPLLRLLMLAAFGALILLPEPAAFAAIAALLAFSAARGGSRRLTRGRSSHGRGGEVVLGVNKNGSLVRLGDNELSAHGLILGASGAGKTTTLLAILSDQIRRGRPVVAIDMKGSPAFVRVLEESAAAAGRPISVWTIDGGAHWNPLAHGNATELKDKLIGTERFTEPHYQRAAERYIQTVLQVIRQSHADRPPTLQEVVALMDPRRLGASLRALDRPLRERVQDYLTGLTHDQLSAVRGLQTRLAILTESHTGPFLAPPADPTRRAIDLRATLSGPEVVVFSLNSSTYGKLAAQIGTLAVQDLVAASGDRLHEPSRGRSLEQAVIGIDEFSGLGSDHVAALLSRGRESGMPVLVATQELADLERASAGLRDLVLGVTAVKIVHRQEVPSSALTIAQIAGTERVWEETRQIGGLLGGLLGGQSTPRGTRRLEERYIVDPNAIKSLGTGEAVVISKMRGAKPQTVRVTPPRRPPPPDLGR